MRDGCRGEGTPAAFAGVVRPQHEHVALVVVGQDDRLQAAVDHRRRFGCGIAGADTGHDSDPVLVIDKRDVWDRDAVSHGALVHVYADLLGLRLHRVDGVGQRRAT